MNKSSLKLLTEEQVFGEHPIDVIRAVGARCGVTDLAMLQGAETAGSTASGGSPACTAGWSLSTPAGYGDVCVVNAEGKRAVMPASSAVGIRPVLPCDDLQAMGIFDLQAMGVSDLQAMGISATADISGCRECEFGEYPQQAADRDLARALGRELLEGRLRTTGKYYSFGSDEYEYLGRKFIKTLCRAEGPVRLSDQRTYQKGDLVWLEVTPVKWLYDEEAGLLVSRKVLALCGQFAEGNFYDGRFEDTGAGAMLRTVLWEDLAPSRLRELTGEEKEARQRELKEAQRRRNPYDLRFGRVTEEDIIRGAIESDVPVFLHGASSEGKSARVKQIDPTCELIYLRNATPDSLNGRSVYNQSTGDMIDIPPTWYNKVKARCEAEPDRFHVVFFDEINNALPSIQGMAFNIVLDREVNGLWKLPPNARVVAAGNDMQDSLAANQIAAPFFNRFAHVYINTTTEQWLDWARDNHIHPAIYSYIAYRRGETLRSPYNGERPNADPRKWEMASKMLYATGRPEMLRSLVGEEITDEFVRFCNQPVITLQRVLADDVTESEIESLNTAERYATTMGLSQAEDKDIEKTRAFVCRLGEEFGAVFDSLRAVR